MIIAHEGVVISSRNAPWQGLGAGMNINDGKNSLPSMSAEWRANGQQTHAAPTHAGIDPRPEILDLLFFQNRAPRKDPKMVTDTGWALLYFPIQTVKIWPRFCSQFETKNWAVFRRRFGLRLDKKIDSVDFERPSPLYNSDDFGETWAVQLASLRGDWGRKEELISEELGPKK